MMNNLILCEGFDDAYILGYFLHKTKRWKRTNEEGFHENYKFPKAKRNQGIEYYKKDDSKSKLAIWSVGGKDSYNEAIKFIATVNEQHPDFGIANVFIITDSDDQKPKEHLKHFESILEKNNINIDELKNNECTTYNYTIEGKDYKLNIVPIIIPFDAEGAIETILIRAIKEATQEDSFIVDKAKEYVRVIKDSEKVNSYLQKNRQILKAEFSAIISITNPDCSTTIYNNLLMSHEWEKSEHIKNQFKGLVKYL